MSRQDRRRAERKVNKELNVLRKMPEADVMNVNDIINKVSNQKTDEMIEAIDRSLTAILIDEDYSLDEVNKLMDKLSVYLNEDILKFREYKKENSEMKNIDIKVKEYMKKLMVKGGNKKEIIEDAVCKFPTLSKTAITNLYGVAKEEFMKSTVKEEKKDAVKSKEIIEEVSKDLEKKIKEEEKEIEKVAKDITENGKKLIKEFKEGIKEIKGDNKVSKFKINKEEVIKKLEFEGENGTYRAETNVGVTLENNGGKLEFRSKEELNKFYQEFEQAFELI